MDRLFMRVVGLRQAAQKHCHGGDVLTGSSELRGIGPPIYGVVPDLMGVPLGAARQSLRVGRSVVRRACRRSWWLVQPLLS